MGTAAFLDYYETALDLLQAKICSSIATKLIKIIDPYRKVKYPYRNPENGIPLWWPLQVPYDSPHNLKKNGKAH